MVVNVIVQFHEVNYAAITLHLKEGETIADALRSRKDASIINGYFYKDGYHKI